MDRGLLDGTAGTALGSNVGATLEPAEPRHAGKRGGHSIWVRWQAPAQGLLHLSTQGSAFDTLLAVYRVPDDWDGAQPFKGLEATGDEDDEEGLFTSTLVVSVKAGRQYAIAVDGYAGATGDVQLSWRFDLRFQVTAQILSVPFDRAGSAGDAVDLEVGIQSGEGAQFRWFRDGSLLPEAHSAVLSLGDLRPSDAGHYRLEVKTPDTVLMSRAVEIQLNSEGQRGVLARNKPFDALDTPMVASAGTVGRSPAVGVGLAQIGVVRGLNGTQVFNTTSATRDPGEPAHCGVVGGATYWFAYAAAEDGQLHFDTIGSSFSAVLAAYTFDPPLLGYDQLTSVACDVASGPGGAGTVDFLVRGGRTYLVVLDGLGGARGEAHLNYRFTRVEQPVDAPVVAVSPAGQVLASGRPLGLGAVVTGTEPLSFQWERGGVAIAGATNREFNLAAARVADTGDYRLVVTNRAGMARSDVARVTVLDPPVAAAGGPWSQRAMVGSRWEWAAEASGSPPLSYQWYFGGKPIAGATSSTLVLPEVGQADTGDYRWEATNPVGTARSAVMHLDVVTTTTVSVVPSEATVVVGGQVRFRALVTGAAVRSVVWYRGDDAVPVGTEPDLVLTNLQVSAGGQYAALVTTDVGERPAVSCRLNVVPPPTVVVSPAEAVGAVGRSVSFAVAVSGAQAQRFQWVRAGVPLKGATNATLVLGDLSAEQAGVYAVTVTTELGTFESRASRLTVQPPPVVTVVPTESIVAEGGEAMFTVSVQGAIPLRLNWRRDTEPLADATNATLVLRRVATGEEGLYRATVTTALGEFEATGGRLRVARMPVIRNGPRSAMVAVGGRARFRVDAEAGPGGALTWRREGTSSALGSGAELVLERCAPEHAGVYTVEVRNPAGLVRSTPVRLEVLSAPRARVSGERAGMDLWFPTVPGERYVLRASSALDGAWTPLAEGVADETGVVLRREPTADPVQRFFRCSSP